jgi:hypothetical protein
MSIGRTVSSTLPLDASSPARGVLGRWGHVAAYPVLGALTLSPLLWAAVPPLIDYPEHLARLSSGDDSCQ